MPRQKLTVEERKAAGKRSKPDAPNINAVEISAIKKPPGMSKPASKLWDQIFPELMKAGLLSNANAGVMADYCEIEAQIADLRKKLQQPGAYFTTHPNGTTSMSLDCKLHEKLSKDQMKRADFLGLSPKARRSQNIMLIPQQTGKQVEGRVPAAKRKTILGRFA